MEDKEYFSKSCIYHRFSQNISIAYCHIFKIIKKIVNKFSYKNITIFAKCHFAQFERVYTRWKIQIRFKRLTGARLRSLRTYDCWPIRPICSIFPLGSSESPTSTSAQSSLVMRVNAYVDGDQKYASSFFIFNSLSKKTRSYRILSPLTMTCMRLKTVTIQFHFVIPLFILRLDNFILWYCLYYVRIKNQCFL